ncbi:type III secretion protein [Bordetella pertussis]|uniref:Type III secretion protein n=4 Tax=Bordetella pertussis TaxID=520 RepID=Q79GR0_BORPE|nr:MULTISPECIES: type III secretion system central stalk protein BscO [Bordetella]ETH38949.1 type III secretion protein YscO [Bordetella pertussis H918]ETH44913.1 type III secretion protein YscO [Bordetella pertussis H939]ETH48499.1 type III secretion protein YscO [Bordetella pertussis H921]ETH71448.1 type III secretion protein YscO [Bordetella pertussis STO1-CHLA-0011]ETH84124.1 type III secretion protein YscO [Bordetella pertussis STO1-CHOC-0017]ETH87935.1 type III secretion protein YscO [B
MDLESLLAIKHFRADQAQLALKRQQQACAVAAAAQRQAQGRLDDCRLWAGQLENRLYAELCRRIVKTRDIDEVLQRVGHARDRQASLALQLDDAVRRHEHEIQLLAQQREQHRECFQAQQRIAELVRLQQVEAAALRESQEDREIQEAIELSARGRDDASRAGDGLARL